MDPGSSPGSPFSPARDDRSAPGCAYIGPMAFKCHPDAPAQFDQQVRQDGAAESKNPHAQQNRATDFPQTFTPSRGRQGVRGDRQPQKKAANRVSQPKPKTECQRIGEHGHDGCRWNIASPPSAVCCRRKSLTQRDHKRPKSPNRHAPCHRLVLQSPQLWMQQLVSDRLEPAVLCKGFAGGHGFLHKRPQ